MSDEDPRRLAGSPELASFIERRRFLRKTANTIFYSIMTTAVAGFSLGGLLSDPAQATGGGCGCPTNNCCGPSPCCNTSCCNKNCCSPNSSTCNHNANCDGEDTSSPYNSTCWSCTSMVGCQTTTCCDCKTLGSMANCSNPLGIHRCICYQIRHQCDEATLATLPGPVYIDTIPIGG